MLRIAPAVHPEAALASQVCAIRRDPRADAVPRAAAEVRPVGASRRPATPRGAPSSEGGRRATEAV